MRWLGILTGVMAGKKEFIETFTTTGVTLEPFEITNRTFVPLGAEAAIAGGEARCEVHATASPSPSTFAALIP